MRAVCVVKMINGTLRSSSHLPLQPIGRAVVTVVAMETGYMCSRPAAFTFLKLLIVLYRRVIRATKPYHSATAVAESLAVGSVSHWLLAVVVLNDDTFRNKRRRILPKGGECPSRPIRRCQAHRTVAHLFALIASVSHDQRPCCLMPSPPRASLISNESMSQSKCICMAPSGAKWCTRY